MSDAGRLECKHGRAFGECADCIVELETLERREIEKKLAKLDAERAELQKQLDASLSRTLVTCTNNCYGKDCGKKSQIGKITYIATFWYTSPCGCTEGDYWTEGGRRIRLPPLRPPQPALRSVRDPGSRSLLQGPGGDA